MTNIPKIYRRNLAVFVTGDIVNKLWFGKIIYNKTVKSKKIGEVNE